MSTIELVPSPQDASIQDRLGATLQKAQSLRAAVAYWTIPNNIFGSALASCLAKTGSYLCVDIHLPTNIDCLTGLAFAGANVFLYLKSFPGETETQKAPSMPPHLLHTKMLLFDLPGGKAELWVGSHNWTKRALVGPNIEASIIVQTAQTDPIYRQAVEYLDYIHRECMPFIAYPPDFYKQLQVNERESTELVIELEGHKVDKLQGKSITIFGTDRGDLEALNRIGRTVYLSILNSETEREYLYQSRIIQSGEMPAANPLAAGLSFSKRRCAYRRGKGLPVLGRPVEPDPNFLATAHYFVTLAITDPLLPDTYTRPPLESAQPWKVTFDDPLLERMRPEDQAELENRKRTKVKVPYAPEEFSLIREQARLLEPSLDIKRVKERELVTRKVLVRPEVNNFLPDFQNPDDRRSR